MNKHQTDVLIFMQQVCEVPIPLLPEYPDLDTALLCSRLIREEEGELTEALWKAAANKNNLDNIVEVADGMADLIYVVYYLANKMGIDLEPIWNEVQRSNMTKLGGGKNAYGKLMKPPGYTPPQLRPLIQEQISGKVG